MVRRASATRMGIGMAAFFENFIGTGVASHTFFLHASIAYHARHSPALPLRARFCDLTSDKKGGIPCLRLQSAIDFGHMYSMSKSASTAATSSGVSHRVIFMFSS